MRKLGGLVLIAAFALTSCSVPAANSAVSPEPKATDHALPQKWVTKGGQSFDITSVSFNESALDEFAKSVADVPGYAISTANLAVIGKDICEHYAGGFTTEDLRTAGGPSLAIVGEAAKVTVCAK